MSETDLKNLAGDLDAIAAYWVVRLGSDDCTPEDRFAFDAWRREDPAHAAAYEKIKSGNDYLDRFMGAPEFQDRIELARKRTAPASRTPRYAAWISTAAACVAVAAIGFLWVRAPGGEVPVEPSVTIAETVEAYETQIGERSTVTLSDGSVVTINTNSRIEVDYSDSMREVTLVRGQGFFDVAEETDRPFVVNAGEKRVVALGTIFDVRFDDANEVQVTLVEGRVQVDSKITPAKGARSSNSTSQSEEMVHGGIELSPGERLITRADSEPQIVETDGVEETSWRRGQLVFRQRELAHVVDEMNRYSAQQLVLDADERVLALKVSGVFNNGGPPSAFVDALEAMHPLEARRSGRDELTLVWRE